MVPLCYRIATVNGLKNPACVLYAPFSDVQDANEMRMVEDAILRIFTKKHFAISKKSSIFAANIK